MNMMNMMNQKMLSPGIADRTKARIDAITEQVTSEQYIVTQRQAIVTSLTAKSAQFSATLATASDTQATALTNLNLANDALAAAAALTAGTAQAQAQAAAADLAMIAVCEDMALMINKLVFTGEIIDRLVQLINKQKAANPLIPDSIITYLNQATTDANNAVALTLTALQSCYAAQATLRESRASMNLSAQQSAALQARMEHQAFARGATVTSKVLEIGYADDCAGVVAWLQQGYLAAKDGYNQALWNNDSVGAQLSYAQAMLASATTDLNSYKSGLNAATAAAYAS